MYDANSQSRGMMVVTPVTIPGADAYFMHVGKTITIRLRKSGRVFQIRMNPGAAGKENAAQIEGIEKGLAEKAVTRF
jgi:hypothetical protein